MPENTPDVYLYKDLTPLHNERHADYGLTKTEGALSFAREAHMAPVHINEIPAVVTHYPIVFAGEERLPAVALGIEEGRNLFIDNDSKWAENHYIPEYILRYPFLLVRERSNNDAMLLCIDAQAPQISSIAPESPFFENGEYSELTKQVLELCLRFEQSSQLTKKLIDELDELEVFCTKMMGFTDAAGEEKRIEFVGIDEKKIEALSDEEFLKLRKSGAITLVYAHLFSLSNWNRVIARL